MDPVGVVLVNYQSDADLLVCLASLGRITSHRLQVCVCDVAAADQSPQRMAGIESALFSGGSGGALHQLDVRSIPDNRGFAYANNVGIETLRSRYPDLELYWLLNPDTVVPTDVLSVCSRALRDKPKVGLLGMIVRNWPDNGEVQAVGGLLNRFFLTTAHIGVGLAVADPRLAELSAEADYPIGASLLVRREFIERVGLLSDAYFLFYEEPDWVHRARGHMEVSICADAFIWHKGGAVTGGAKSSSKSAISDWHGLRSRCVFARRHYSKWHPGLLMSLGVATLKRLCRGHYRRVSWPLRAWREVFRKVS
jgi:GT2 family glycosyltransferase